MALAMRWLKEAAKKRGEVDVLRQANELMEATEGRRHENVTRFTAWPSQQGQFSHFRF
jgi:ribosomal protein S7